MLELRCTKSSAVRSAAYPPLTRSGPSGAVRCSHLARMWRNGGTIHNTRAGVATLHNPISSKCLKASGDSEPCIGSDRCLRLFKTASKLSRRRRIRGYSPTRISQVPPDQTTETSNFGGEKKAFQGEKSASEGCGNSLGEM